MTFMLLRTLHRYLATKHPEEFLALAKKEELQAQECFNALTFQYEEDYKKLLIEEAEAVVDACTNLKILMWVFSVMPAAGMVGVLFFDMGAGANILLILLPLWGLLFFKEAYRRAVRRTAYLIEKGIFRGHI